MGEHLFKPPSLALYSKTKLWEGSMNNNIDLKGLNDQSYWFQKNQYYWRKSKEQFSTDNGQNIFTPLCPATYYKARPREGSTINIDLKVSMINTYLKGINDQ